MENKEICGTCEYHKYYDGEWYCMCEYSDANGCITDYNDSCEEYEER